MALAIRKPDQGYWTRVLSAVGAAVLVLAFVAWLWQQMTTITDQQTRFIAQTVTTITILLVSGVLIFWVMNKPAIVDFLIATDSEMRKVNWPTRKEITGSTWVVIIGMLLLAVILWVIDIAFLKFFQSINIIVGG